MRKVVIVMSLCLSLFSVSGCSLFESPDKIYYTQEYELNGKRYEYIERNARAKSRSLFSEVRYRRPSIGTPSGRTYISLYFIEGSGLLVRRAELYSDTTFFVAGKRYVAGKNTSSPQEPYLELVEDGVCFECTKKWTRDTIYCKNGRIDIYKSLPINGYWDKDFLRTE